MSSNRTSSEARQRRIGVGVASIGLALVICEGWLRIFVPPQIYPLIGQVIQQDISIPSTEAGYINRPLARQRFRNPEFDTDVRINAHSLRDQDYPYGASSRFRIVALGDSFAFGWGVEQPQIVTEVLERDHLQQADVINLGVSGYETLQEAAWFRVEGVKYRPNLALLFWYSNDLAMGVPHPYFHRGRMYDQDETLFNPFRAFRTYLKRHVYLCALYSVFERDLKDRLRGRPLPSAISQRVEYPPSQWTRMRDALAALKQQVEGASARLVVVAIPFKRQLEPEATLGRLTQELGIPCLDLGEVFAALPATEQRRLYYRLDDHWTPAGHRAAARLVAQYLQKARLIPPEFVRRRETVDGGGWLRSQ